MRSWPISMFPASVSSGDYMASPVTLRGIPALFYSSLWKVKSSLLTNGIHSIQRGTLQQVTLTQRNTECTHSEVDIRCKAKVNQATTHNPREAGLKKGGPKNGHTWSDPGRKVVRIFCVNREAVEGSKWGTGTWRIKKTELREGWKGRAMKEIPW